MMAVLVLAVCDNDEEYIDPVIDMLLNGVSAEITEVTNGTYVFLLYFNYI